MSNTIAKQFTKVDEKNVTMQETKEFNLNFDMFLAYIEAEKKNLITFCKSLIESQNKAKSNIDTLNIAIKDMYEAKEATGIEVELPELFDFDKLMEEAKALPQD